MLTTKPIDLRPDHAEIIHQILKDNLEEGTSVFAFGSRANWTAKQSSDLDLAIDSFGEKLERKIKANLEDAFDECDLPYSVDVDYNSISNSFREAIKGDLVRVLWDWKEVRVCDFAKITSGGTPSTKNMDYYDGAIPWITPKDLSNFNYRYINKGGRNISKLGLVNSSAKVIPVNSILMSSRAPIGYLAIAANDLTTNQGFKSLTVDKLYDYLYIYYLLKNNIDKIESFASGSTFKEISKTTFEEIKFNLPPLSEQKRIAEILSSLDDKIEINKQINQTLEEMAQALFKSWFIDFDPVKAKKAVLESGGSEEEANFAAMKVISSKSDDELKKFKDTNPSEYQELEETARLFPSEFQDSELGEIPLGWEVKSLDEIGNYLNGLALQKYRPCNGEKGLPVLKIAQLKKGSPDYKEFASEKIKEEYIVKNGDIIFSWSGSLLVDIWCGDKVALNQHLFKVTSEDYPKWFVYFSIKKHIQEFQKIASDKAVTMGHIKREHLKLAKCVTCNSSKLNLFFKKQISITLALSSKMKVDLNELITMRNCISPKLISGNLIANIRKDKETIS